MKNKKFTYILLPVVLLIWGGILYKIFGSLKGGDDGALQKLKTPIAMPLEAEKLDTFSIVANYRDPFLGTIKVKSKPKKRKKAVKKKEPEKKVIPWPNINYGGIIRNTNSEVKTVIVNVGGIERILQEGSELNGVLLSKIMGDSILVSFNEQNRVIKK